MHQRIDYWFEKYTCGPGRHQFVGTGINMTPTARTAPPGRAIDLSDADEITECSRCGKSGWAQTPTCEVCDQYPVDPNPNRVLVLADDTRLSGATLCDSCHVDLIDGNDPRVQIEWLRDE